jgi:hypothetical protein
MLSLPVKLFGPSAYVHDSFIYVAGLDSDNKNNTVIFKLEDKETRWSIFREINGYCHGGFSHLTFSNDLQ